MTTTANKPACSELLRGSRLKSLDLLRFVAVTMVLLRHMTPEHPNPVINRICSAGWAGVDLFFVLSGFLIGGLLLSEARKNDGVNLRRFYVRRSLKIYPAFLALVVFYAPVEKLIGTRFSWRGLLCELLFLQNYLWRIFNHTWSLAIEEHFYLLIGVTILYLSARRALAVLPAIAFSVFLLCLAGRVVTFLAFGSINISATHLRMDSLAAGVLLAWIREFRPAIFMRVSPRWLSVAAAMLAPLFWFEPESSFYSTAGFTLNYLGFGIILVFALNNEKWLCNQGIVSILAGLGALSYTTYLWHMPVKRLFSFLRQQSVLDLGWSGELLAYVVVSFAVGLLMAYLSERPALAFRDRVMPFYGQR